jgi:hypothetical protein
MKRLIFYPQASCLQALCQSSAVAQTLALPQPKEKGVTCQSELEADAMPGEDIVMEGR